VQRLRELRQETEVREGLEWAAAASREEVNREVTATVAEVGKSHPPRMCKAMTDYMTHFPPILRQAMRRPSDPSGRTVPAWVRLEFPEALLPYLPRRVPRYRAGARPREPLDSWQLVELLGMSHFGETWRVRHVEDSSRTPSVLKFCTDIEAGDMMDRH